MFNRDKDKAIPAAGMLFVKHRITSNEQVLFQNKSFFASIFFDYTVRFRQFLFQLNF